MKSKFFMAVIATLMVIVTPAVAQQWGGHYDNEYRDCNSIARNRTERLDRVVRLSYKQERSAYKIYSKYCKQIQKAERNNDRRAVSMLNERTNREIYRILNPEQQRQWRRAQSQYNRPNNRPYNNNSGGRNDNRNNNHRPRR